MIYQLPCKEDIDRASLSDEKYFTLLNSGAGYLNPRNGWGTTAFVEAEELDYVYRCNGNQLYDQLSIAADLLYRAWEKQSARRGLIVVEKGNPEEIKELPRMMVNPSLTYCYRMSEAWMLRPCPRTKPIVQKETIMMTRKLGDSPCLKILITCVRKINFESPRGSKFSILSVWQTERELFFRVEPDTGPSKAGKIVEVSGIHPQLDGMLLVKKATNTEFTAATPCFSNSMPRRQWYNNLKEAKGQVMYHVQEKDSLYHLDIKGETRIPDNRTRYRNEGYVRSRYPEHSQQFNPFVRMNNNADQHRRESFRRQLLNPSSDNRPESRQTRSDSSLSGQSRNFEYLKSMNERKRLIEYCFEPDRVSRSLRVLLKEFGVHRVSVAFDRSISRTPCYRPTPSQNIDIGSMIKSRKALINTEAQKRVIRNIENGENWLILSQYHDIKIATFLHMIQCLFTVEPRVKVLILVHSFACAERLQDIITDVSIQFGLHRSRFRSICIPIKGSNLDAQKPYRSYIALNNIIITTAWFLDQLLSTNVCTLDIFSLLIWDHCEDMAKPHAGHNIIECYKHLPFQAQQRLKIYAFSVNLSKPDRAAQAINLENICNNLCIPPRNVCRE